MTVVYDVDEETLCWAQLPVDLKNELTDVPGRRLEVLNGFDSRWIPFGIFDTITMEVTKKRQWARIVNQEQHPVVVPEILDLCSDDESTDATSKASTPSSGSSLGKRKRAFTTRELMDEFFEADDEDKEEGSSKGVRRRK